METSATTTQPQASGARGAEAWHTLQPEEVARKLKTDAARGLGRAEVERRQGQHGPNELEQAEGRSAFAILLAQFKSLIVALLVVATAIAFAMGENLEGIAILVVILLNAAVGFFTEWKAQAALTALRRQAVPTAHVLRDGAEHEIAAAELVPGDIVLVDAGSRVPADGRVFESAQLQVAEASLTGESHAVAKEVGPIDDPKAPLGDRTNMLYMGTAITDGRGKFIVTSIGSQTEVGHIGTMIEQAGTRETPLERKLAQLGNSLVGVVLVLCAVIVGFGWLRGNELLAMLEVGISLAIAAVPEGLPAVTTMTLALGMQRMAKMRALIRRLPAVETLGSTTVICTDKTGTLTRNEMTLERLNLAGRVIEITGTGYAAEGEFREEGERVDPAADEQLALALRIGALCSDATIERTDAESKVLGDPTEGALVVAAEKGGMPKGELEGEYPRIGEIPFSSESQRMTTVHRTPEGKVVAYLKGGPAVVVEASSHQLDAEGVHPLDDQRREAALEHVREMAAQALRVLAIATKELPGEEHDEAELESGYTLVGMLGMIDPLREEAREAIATCRDAGIRTVMITGDQALTAQEIGRQLGLDRDAEGHKRRTAHGRDLADLEPEEWHKFASEVAVFARVSPEHKLRIVEALQSGGDVVAMTGDGVNDAPALKQADIGIAMGIKGTEVAKEAAAMVITDDNFATIVGAVEQGRVIYSNIRRFVHYLFSCNLAEILVVFVSLLLGWPLPLGALQILWLNMITDVFPALSLALEPAAPDVMKQQPRDPREPLLNRRFVWLITWQGTLLTAATLVAFAIGRHWYGDDAAGHAHSTTIAFMTLAISQVFHVFNARSQRDSAFSTRMFANPWLWGAIGLCLLLQYAAVTVPLLQSVLGTVPPTLRDWGLIAICSLAPVVVVEIVKLVRRLTSPRSHH